VVVVKVVVVVISTNSQLREFMKAKK